MIRLDDLGVAALPGTGEDWMSGGPTRRGPSGEPFAHFGQERFSVSMPLHHLLGRMDGPGCQVSLRDGPSSATVSTPRSVRPLIWLIRALALGHLSTSELAGVDADSCLVLAHYPPGTPGDEVLAMLRDAWPAEAQAAKLVSVADPEHVGGTSVSVFRGTGAGLALIREQSTRT